MSENQTVYIVDDDPGALESLRWMLEQADYRVKAFRNGRDFLDQYRGDEAGCLVCDVRMPEMDGLALQQAVRDRRLRLPMIFITAYGDVPTCARAFRNGAADFLEKPVNDKLLLSHIARIMASAEERRRNSRADDFGERRRLLTPTESEILDLLVEGRSIKEIARTRKVSVQTIWRHQMNIFHKLGIESHLELVRIATEWQLQKQEAASLGG